MGGKLKGGRVLLAMRLWDRYRLQHTLRLREQIDQFVETIEKSSSTKFYQKWA
jgi:hypothetical protein